MNLTAFCRFVILLIVVSIFAGCRRLPPPPDGLPPLHPCKITVTFGGAAIEGVTVSLVSKEPGLKWKSGGMTNAKGVAELRTSFAYLGVPEGTFTVGFVKIMDQEAEARTMEEMASMSAIPIKYAPDKSEETVEIKKGKNEFTFNLDAGQERYPIFNTSIPTKR